MGRRKQAVTKGLKRLTVSLFLGANLCTILLLWLCVALTFVSPDYIPRLSLLTLAFPAFLAVDVLFIFFWLIFHARLAWVPVAGLLLVGSYVLDYCPLGLGREASGEEGITVVSYNVGTMKGDENEAALRDFLAASDADIICMQELSQAFMNKEETRQWLKDHPYNVLQSGGETILSRYAFIGDTIRIDYPTRSNHSTAVWIDLDGDSLLLINNHLESNHLTPEEKSEYTGMIRNPHRQTVEDGSRMLVGKLSAAASYRGAQTDTICAMVDRYAAYPVIVCGDLNDTPVSYVYQRLDARLSSAFRQGGRGLGISYSQRAFMVRIDHVFFPSGWTCSSCSIDRSISVSDHYPVTCRLHKNVR